MSWRFTWERLVFHRRQPLGAQGSTTHRRCHALTALAPTDSAAAALDVESGGNMRTSQATPESKTLGETTLRV